MLLILKRTHREITRIMGNKYRALNSEREQKVKDKEKKK